jgi:hypothetical protein
MEASRKAVTIQDLVEQMLQERLVKFGVTADEMLFRAQRRVELMQHNQRKYHNDMTENGTIQIPLELLSSLTHCRAAEKAWKKGWNKLSVIRDDGRRALSSDLVRVSAQLIVDILSD